MKKKIIVMLLAITMTAFAACGHAEEVVNPQVEAVEPSDEVEGNEEKTENLDETDDENSEETETVEEEDVEGDPTMNTVLADEEFLNYVNEKRAEAGLDIFYWSDEMFSVTSERVEEFVATNKLSASDTANMQLWGGVKVDEYDVADIFASNEDMFLSSYEGYIAGGASVGTYNNGEYWYYVFDSNFIPMYSYTEMPATTYYAVDSVNVRRQPSKDGVKLVTLNKGEAVTVIAQCNETGWYKVQDEYGGVGYVSDNYLSLEKPVMQVASNKDTGSSSNSGSGSGNYSGGAVDLDNMTDEEFQQWLLGLYGISSFEEFNSVNFGSAWDSARLFTEILSLVNNARADAGLGALTWDNNLDSDAMRRAVEISNNFVHENIPSGCMENIFGMSSDSNGVSASACFNTWWNSENHRAAMLNENVTRVSVAIYFDGGSSYVSMLLGI